MLASKILSMNKKGVNYKIPLNNFKRLFLNTELPGNKLATQNKNKQSRIALIIVSKGTGERSAFLWQLNGVRAISSDKKSPIIFTKHQNKQKTPYDGD